MYMLHQTDVKNPKFEETEIILKTPTLENNESSDAKSISFLSGQMKILKGVNDKKVFDSLPFQISKNAKKEQNDLNTPSTDTIFHVSKENKLTTYICDVSRCAKIFTDENELRVVIFLFKNRSTKKYIRLDFTSVSMKDAQDSITFGTI